MTIYFRDSKGRFISKTNAPKNNRSIRVTDEAWEIFTNAAFYLGIAKGDLFQMIVMGIAVQSYREQ